MTFFINVNFQEKGKAAVGAINLYFYESPSSQKPTGTFAVLKCVEKTIYEIVDNFIDYLWL